jgi:S1-C subfamily serine protease
MKRLRPLLLALLLVGGFYWFTTSARHGAFDLAHIRGEKIEVSEAASNAPLTPDEQNTVALYKRVLPAVVNVTSVSVAYDFFYGAVPQEGQGSGFIIDKEGHILTNYHVVQGARQLTVTLADKRQLKATVIGADPMHDLAVVKIDAPNLTFVTLGDSKSLQVGQSVYAIGNPFGLNGSMSRGIISSIRSIRTAHGFIDEAIQTDAAINPGNSGGPLLNAHGEVIGIDTMILSETGQSAGIGFAIPINTAKAVLNDLVQYGRVKRPSLGIRGLPVGPELAHEMGLPADNGVLIMDVYPGGAAARAGLHGGTERAYLGNFEIKLGGDLIVALNGERVEDLMDVSHFMANHRAGEAVKVTVFRKNQKLDVNVTLGEAQEQ